jgi:tetratricopeptide (TPR) repeat protein
MVGTADDLNLSSAYNLLRSGKIDAALKEFRIAEADGNRKASYYIGHIFSGNYDGYFDFDLAQEKLKLVNDSDSPIVKKELGYLYYRVQQFAKSAEFLQNAVDQGDAESSFWNYLALLKSNSDKNKIDSALKKSFDMGNPYGVRKYSLEKIKNGRWFEKPHYFLQYLKSAYLFAKFEPIEKNLVQ